MKTNFTQKLFLLASPIIFLAAFKADAQTFATKAAGNWSNPSTWVGGNVPGTTIAAGQTVNINHAVVYNYNTDLKISGSLNVTGDTLRFESVFTNKRVDIISGGILKVVNGGLLQNLTTTSSDMSIDMGKVIFTNSKITISKDFITTKGATRTMLNSTLIVVGKYDIKGTGSDPSVDTIKFSMVETGDNFIINPNSSLKVSNAYIKINNGKDFINKAAVSILPGSNSNMGFDYLKASTLKNDGSWNARIDAYCVNTINGSQMGDIDFTRQPDCSGTPQIGPAPELTFNNPVLVSGTDKKQGAIYRFANVMNGVDAQIKLKKFSRNDIVIQNFDLASMGWDKAFQPQFGLPGNVAPNQNWYIDFELKFYVAGTNTLKVLPKVDMTALDVDGDGVSIYEYVSFQNPSNVSYSTVNNLTEQPSNLLGQVYTCSIDNVPSVLISCALCGGDGKTGLWNLTDCSSCNETGILHAGCNHAFEGINASIVNGPVTNFNNIDTSSTQVMAVYQYTDRSVINFRYGGKSGTSSSTAGTRLNSLWFRQFSLAPVMNVTLPIKLASFNATLNNKKVDVKWTTVMEENVSHFTIERSFDGISFTDLATVFAYGNSNEARNYAYPDDISTVQSNVLFYRLRSNDIDGKTQYSDIRIIKLSNKNVNTIHIVTYPNPAANQVNVTVPNHWQNKKVAFEIFSANGQVQKRTENNSSSQTESINISNLAPGIYIVQATCNGETAQQKIIKQ